MDNPTLGPWHNRGGIVRGYAATPFDVLGPIWRAAAPRDSAPLEPGRSSGGSRLLPNLLAHDSCAGDL